MAIVLKDTRIASQQNTTEGIKEDRIKRLGNSERFMTEASGGRKPSGESPATFKPAR